MMLRFLTLHAEYFFMLLLLSADFFFPNKLFQILFQEHTTFGSRSGPTFRKQQKSLLTRRELNMSWPSDKSV